MTQRGEIIATATKTIAKIKEILDELTSNPDDYDTIKMAVQIYELVEASLPHCGEPSWVHNQSMLKAPLGSPVELTQEEADMIVKLAFGRRPDLKPGKEFVDEVRHYKSTSQKNLADYGALDAASDQREE